MSLIDVQPFLQDYSTAFRTKATGVHHATTTIPCLFPRVSSDVQESTMLWHCQYRDAQDYRWLRDIHLALVARWA